MSAAPLAWTCGATAPTVPGWYAVLQSWEVQVVPSALRWQDEGWDWHGASTIIAWCGPFPSPAVAQEWAQDNEPE
jgi:hypothetical protein